MLLRLSEAVVGAQLLSRLLIDLAFTMSFVAMTWSFVQATWKPSASSHSPIPPSR